MAKSKRGRGRPPKDNTKTGKPDPEDLDPLEDEDDPEEETDLEEGEGEGEGERPDRGGGGKGRSPTSWKPQNAPEGLETFMRNRKWETKDFHVRIYEMLPQPRVPGKEKAVLRQVVHGEYVDDVWLLEHGFRGRFKTWLFYKEGKYETKMDMGTWEVSPMSQPGPSEPGSLTPTGTAAGPGQPGTAGGGLAIGFGGQVLSLNDVLLLKQVFGPPEGSAPAFGGGDIPGLSIMERMHERQLKRADDLMQKLEEKVYKAPSVPKPPEEEKKNPPWLDSLMERYLPKLQKHIDKLLGEDGDAKDFRQFITGTAEFRSLFSDPEKKQKIASVLVETLKDKGAELFNYLEKEATA